MLQTNVVYLTTSVVWQNQTICGLLVRTLYDTDFLVSELSAQCEMSFNLFLDIDHQDRGKEEKKYCLAPLPSGVYASQGNPGYTCKGLENQG